MEKSRPRLFVLIITWVTKVRRDVGDVEGVMDAVLGLWDVYLVCIVVDALENLERAISSWRELRLSLIGEAVFALV